jgi:hypothetical protein
MKAKIFLSRRNLKVLLSKLDRLAAGEETACTIIKYKNKDDPPLYAQMLDEITITAVEDDEYYARRPAGAMHPKDEQIAPKTGTAFSLKILDL